MRRLRVRWLVALGLFALATAAAADYLDDYRAGLEAYEEERWAEAAGHFERAIAQRPQESGLLTGPLLRRYTPHHYLGLSLARIGTCRQAMAALDESERQGRARETEEVAAARALCRQRLESTDRAAAEAREAIDRAASTAAAVALIESSPLLGPLWNEGDPSYAARQGAALEELAQARMQLDEGVREGDEESLADATRLAASAAEQLAALRGDAEERRESLRREIEAELTRLHALQRLARRELDFVRSRFSPSPPGVSEAAERLDRRLGLADALGAVTPKDDLNQIERALRRDLGDLRRAVKAPPTDLLEAATLYFDGRYREALERLSGLTGDDPRVAAHACLLRAATVFALARLPRDETPAPPPAARELVRECLRGAPVIAPPEGYFPPPFVALYRAEAGDQP